MEKKKMQRIQITELFLIRADWNRTFMAEIIRETTSDGKEFVRGNVVVNEGKIWSNAETQEELGKYLDDICTLKLDYGLHSDAGVTTHILGENFFLN